MGLGSSKEQNPEAEGNHGSAASDKNEDVLNGEMDILSLSPTTSTKGGSDDCGEDPSMQVYFMDFAKFKELKEMPRRPDAKALLTRKEDIDIDDSFIVFISHCWIAGWSGADQWRGVPHPDNKNNDKFELCVKGVSRAFQDLGHSYSKCYIWLDFACINQDANPAAELKQLDQIVEACDVLFTPIVDKEWENWELKETWRGMMVAYVNHVCMCYVVCSEVWLYLCSIVVMFPIEWCTRKP